MLPIQKHKTFRLTYWLYLAVIIVVIAEVLVRIQIRYRYGFKHGAIGEIYQLDATTGLRIPIPNLEIEGVKTHININSLGFRGRELSAAKSPHTIRIAALGASTTFCAEVSNNDSVWLEQVRVKLENRFPSYRFEALNGGVPGYGIIASLKNFRRRIVQLEPDIVIFYEATNDISYASRQAAMAMGIINKNQNHYGSALPAFLSRHSQAFDLFYKNIAIVIRQKQASSALKLNNFPTQSAIPFIVCLDSIRQECEKIRAPLLIFTFCTKFRREQAFEQRLANMNTSLYYMPWMAPDTFFEAFDLFNRKIFEFAQQHESVYVDTLHNAIPGDSKHFIDSVHFSDQGCRVMANRVFNALLHEELVQSVITCRQKPKSNF